MNGIGQKICVKGVSKYFKGTTALKDVTFEIEAGTFLVLLGPSGSGKTTLLRGLAGIEPFDEGTVIFGQDVVSDEAHHLPPEKRRLSMVFQDYALWPHMTVAENINYALKREHLTRNEAQARVSEVLKSVSMLEKADAYPQELSGGQQQRVALARALVAKPSLILFDEPLSNLDAYLRDQLRVEISTMTRETGATVIYITHDQKEAFALADVIGVLASGRLIQFDKPEEIYAYPASLQIAQFTGLAAIFEGRMIEQLESNKITVKVDEYTFTASTKDSIHSGEKVKMAIRPAAVHLLASNNDGDNPKKNLIKGQIIDVAYRGQGYEYVVKTDCGLLNNVIDNIKWSREESCLVVIDGESAIAFADKEI